MHDGQTRPGKLTGAEHEGQGTVTSSDAATGAEAYTAVAQRTRLRGGGLLRWVRTMKKAPQGESASARIDARIRELGDWRGKTLAKVRRIIQEADPDIVEEWKWMGTPV